MKNSTRDSTAASGPRQRRARRAIASTLTALALSTGVATFASTTADAAVRGPDNTVYQLRATCDPYANWITLQVSNFWVGNPPLVSINIWSYDLKRYVVTGRLIDISNTRLTLPNGNYAIQASYYWIVNGQVRSATEWLPAGSYGVYVSNYCQL